MATKKLQIIDSLIKQAENADTLDGKHADEFATASDVETLKSQVGDETVSVQIENAFSSRIYVQSDTPVDAAVGAIWVDTAGISITNAEEVEF